MSPFYALTAILAISANQLPEQVAVLPASEGPELVRPCNAPGPKNIDQFFEPLPEEVIAAENATAALLESHRSDYESIDHITPAKLNAFKFPSNRSAYQRQHIGYVSGGKRITYTVFFPNSVLTLGERFKSRFTTRAAIICDAGPALFMVQYDIAADAVMRIDFSGGWGGGMTSIIPAER